ncbi:fluoride efflux transporter FluC [Nocardioides campestrisoli]|uniref:fluoride efflux transporter FluC n=1 Tax=Nocardioides campestrisoli TaxID=2736757 RepID=UPI0015E6B017|nr:CrcB family protein [Nocardioides campestrisoli]
MTFWLFMLVVLAGGAGAVTRLVLDGLLRQHFTSPFAWSTAIINLSSSLMLGAVTGLVANYWVATDVGAVVSTGYLGGYGTFSTASYETVELIRQRHYGTAVAYGFGVLVGGVLLAFLGYRWGLAV